VRAIYEKMAKKQHKRAYNLAVSDYFNGIDLLSKKSENPAHVLFDFMTGIKSTVIRFCSPGLFQKFQHPNHGDTVP